MKRIRSTVFPLTILLLTITACRKPNQDEAAAKAVLEGYLMDNQTVQVKISLENIKGTADSLLAPIDGLSVQIMHAGVSYLLTETSPGIYQSSQLTVHAGESYHIG